MHKPTAQQLLDTLAVAIGGGIHHWCNTEHKHIRKMRVHVQDDIPISLDFESNAMCRGWEFYNITPILLAQTIDKLQNGELVFASTTSTMRQLCEQDSDGWCVDAEVADVIVQFAAFGRYIYA